MSCGRRQSTVAVVTVLLPVGGLSSPCPGISCTLTSALQVLSAQALAKLCLQRACPKLLLRVGGAGDEAAKGLGLGVAGGGPGLSDNVLWPI